MSFLESIDALLKVDILRGKIRLNSCQSYLVMSYIEVSDLLSCLSKTLFDELLSALRERGERSSSKLCISLRWY